MNFAVPETVLQPRSPVARQTLMIDADDTLWENNIYFEAAIDRFIRFVDHPTLTHAEVRHTFDRLESQRVKLHGYGTDAFHHSLLAGFEHLRGVPCTDTDAEHLAAFAGSIRTADLTLLDGVLETLPHLAERHTLMLVTKGDHEEQVAKLKRSGLEQFFQHVEVLREKHTAAYQDICNRYGCDPAESWMIGNSPRSDTNPALAAGMHAVYLPHYSTWVLEQEPIHKPAEGQRLLHLNNFHQLREHF